jgi:hypothetical protein
VSQHPVNLALRFLLELAAWAAMGYWGWARHAGVLRFVLTIGLPLLAMVLWGTFRVPDDPGRAPVPVPGWVRLLLEGANFGLAVWLTIDAGRVALGIAFGAVLLAHYAVSYDRVRWLLTQ